MLNTYVGSADTGESSRDAEDNKMPLRRLVSFIILSGALAAAAGCATPPPPAPAGETIYQLRPGDEPPDWALCVVTDARTLCGYLSPVTCVHAAEQMDGECIRHRP